MLDDTHLTLDRRWKLRKLAEQSSSVCAARRDKCGVAFGIDDVEQNSWIEKQMIGKLAADSRGLINKSPVCLSGVASVTVIHSILAGGTGMLLVIGAVLVLRVANLDLSSERVSTPVCFCILTQNASARGVAGDSDVFAQFVSLSGNEARDVLFARCYWTRCTSLRRTSVA